MYLASISGFPPLTSVFTFLHKTFSLHPSIQNLDSKGGLILKEAVLTFWKVFCVLLMQHTKIQNILGPHCLGVTGIFLKNRCLASCNAESSNQLFKLVKNRQDRRMRETRDRACMSMQHLIYLILPNPTRLTYSFEVHTDLRQRAPQSFPYESQGIEN
jgi:hypothetical protein